MKLGHHGNHGNPQLNGRPVRINLSYHILRKLLQCGYAPPSTWGHSYGIHMWAYAIWGLAGGLAVEGADILRCKDDSSLPWRSFGLGVYALRVIIRMTLGACVAAGLGSSHEISNSLMAFLSGAGAPLFLEKASQITRVMLPESGQPDQRPSRGSSETVIVTVGDQAVGTENVDAS